MLAISGEGSPPSGALRSGQMGNDFEESRLARVLYGIMVVLFILFMAGMCMSSPGGWEARWG